MVLSHNLLQVESLLASFEDQLLVQGSCKCRVQDVPYFPAVQKSHPSRAVIPLHHAETLTKDLHNVLVYQDIAPSVYVVSMDFCVSLEESTYVFTIIC